MHLGISPDSRCSLRRIRRSGHELRASAPGGCGPPGPDGPIQHLYIDCRNRKGGILRFSIDSGHKRCACTIIPADAIESAPASTQKKVRPFDLTLKRRLPTLPRDNRSTIGVSELNFSVRNGKRWDLTAITT